MIKTTQLRLGNIVGYNRENVKGLHGVQKITISLPEGQYGIVTNIDKNRIMLDCLNRPGTGLYSISSIFPLRLTDEWFLSFGFKKLIRKNSVTVFSPPPEYFPSFKESGSWYPCFLDEDLQQVSSTGVTYVHELQNVYYSFTRKELIIDGSTLLDRIYSLDE